MAIHAPKTAVVSITHVRETLVKQTLGQAPFRRFEIQATKTTDDPEGGRWHADISLSTLDQWKAALCDQAWKAGLTLKVTYRPTGYWDDDLLTVERP